MEKSWNVRFSAGLPYPFPAQKVTIFRDFLKRLFNP
jgi:hypothetical protein